MGWDSQGKWVSGKTGMDGRMVVGRNWGTPGQAPTPNTPLGFTDGLANSFKKFTGTSNYQTDEGMMTGGLGNYGSYTNDLGDTVHLDKGAFESMQGTGLDDSMQINKAGDSGALGGLAAVSQGIGAVSNLMNSINARTALKDARARFGAEKAAMNANYIAGAKGYNEELGRKADVGLALGGNAISPEQRAATLDRVASQRLSENAIV